MRGVNIPHKPIWAALLVGVGLIAFALVKSPDPAEELTNGELTVVTDAPERAFLQPEDEDGNGIPDWQDALLSTETLTAQLPNASTSDWKPQTVTESFTVAFIEGYLRNKTYGGLGRDNEEFATLAADTLGENMVDQKIGQQDITISNDTDTDALRAYGNGLMAIMNKYPAPPENELVVINKALRTNNPQDLEGLGPILNSYRGMIVDMKLIPVPNTYVAEHLALVNSYQAIANDLDGAAKTFTDPALAMVRMKRYQNDVAAMGQAIITLLTKLVKTDNVRFGPEDELYPLIKSNV